MSQDLLDSFCKAKGLEYVELIFVETNYIDGDAVGMYVKANRCFKVHAKIYISKQGLDTDTLLHELSHHYQELRYEMVTHHDYTFFNARKVVDNFVNRKDSD